MSEFASCTNRSHDKSENSNSSGDKQVSNNKDTNIDSLSDCKDLNVSVKDESPKRNQVDLEAMNNLKSEIT